jgi:hypothetical protein
MPKRISPTDLRVLFTRYVAHVGGSVPKIRLLRKLFEKAWCAKTATPDLTAPWLARVPALGQNDVTTLVVHDLCCGEILRYTNGVYTQYCNLLPDGGSAVDIAACANDVDYGSEVAVVWQEVMLANERKRTSARYELLRERVIAEMRAALMM